METKLPVRLIKQKELEEQEVQKAVQEGLTRIQLLARLQEAEPEWETKIEERFSYVYPYEHEVSMKTKLSVSEIKHRAMDRLIEEEQLEQMFPAASPGKPIPKEDSEHLEQTEDFQRYIPTFMEGVQKENLGAKRGTAMHRVLECYDFARPPETLGQQLQEMEEQQRIERELLNLVSVSALKKFLKTDLGVRLQEAAKREKLYREKPFVMGKPASEILEGSASEEMILIQGIIDVFFEEPDGIVLLDYKTDRVKSSRELAGRYHAQLELYQEAIERSTGKKVKERLLYSFCLGEVVSV